MRGGQRWAPAARVFAVAEDDEASSQPRCGAASNIPRIPGELRSTPSCSAANARWCPSTATARLQVADLCVALERDQFQAAPGRTNFSSDHPLARAEAGTGEGVDRESTHPLSAEALWSPADRRRTDERRGCKHNMMNDELRARRNERQHYVPQWILKGFRDSEGKLHAWRVNGQHEFTTGPRGVFVATNINTAFSEDRTKTLAYSEDAYGWFDDHGSRACIRDPRCSESSRVAPESNQSHGGKPRTLVMVHRSTAATGHAYSRHAPEGERSR